MMRGPLKLWINDLLSKDMISKDEYLNSNEVSKLWQQHLSGKFDNSSKLWPIIMWQSWLSDLKITDFKKLYLSYSKSFLKILIKFHLFFL